MAACDADDVLAGVHQACVAGLGDYLGVHLDLHRYEALSYDAHGAVPQPLSLPDAVGEHVGAEVHDASESPDALQVLGFELLDACGWEPRLVADDYELDTAALEELCCLYSGFAACAGDEHGLDSQLFGCVENGVQCGFCVLGASVLVVDGFSLDHGSHNEGIKKRFKGFNHGAH